MLTDHTLPVVSKYKGLHFTLHCWSFRYSGYFTFNVFYITYQQTFFLSLTEKEYLSS